MYKYSNFFQTVYDQNLPVGSLGGSTHYSILRALIWHDSYDNPIKKAKEHTFAIIWDEDHDVRVIKVIEEIYKNCHLQHFCIFGERKGCFTALMTEENYFNLTGDNLYKATKQIAESNEDPWNLNIAKIYDTHNHYIINDLPSKVILYISNIIMLWGLEQQK